VTFLRRLLATWFFAGYFPVASGTVGTAAGIPFYLLIVAVLAPATGGAFPWPVYAIVVAAFVAAAIRIADRGVRFWGKADAGEIVIDEVAGFLVTMFLVPPSAGTVLAGFLLFRVFDVVKPWPASYFDRRHKSGLGVVLDDVCAGAYACVSLHLLRALAARL
jgi:phosphatidylglycerophosphatase A